jgi:hypothetical protein
MPPLMTLKFKSGNLKWLMCFPLELIFWIAAFIFLAMAKPAAHPEDIHFTFCPLANLGLSWCPGCGLGRAITLIFHGRIRESFDYHWLGIPAILIISYRIVTLAGYQRNTILNKRKEK